LLTIQFVNLSLFCEDVAYEREFMVSVSFLKLRLFSAHIWKSWSMRSLFIDKYLNGYMHIFLNNLIYAYRKSTMKEQVYIVSWRQL